jgi:hypothetical protein
MVLKVTQNIPPDGPRRGVFVTAFEPLASKETPGQALPKHITVRPALDSMPSSTARKGDRYQRVRERLPTRDHPVTAKESVKVSLVNRRQETPLSIRGQTLADKRECQRPNLGLRPPIHSSVDRDRWHTVQLFALNCQISNKKVSIVVSPRKCCQRPYSGADAHLQEQGQSSPLQIVSFCFTSEDNTQAFSDRRRV